jgi:hypothetical protein
VDKSRDARVQIDGLITGLNEAVEQRLEADRIDILKSGECSRLFLEAYCLLGSASESPDERRPAERTT